MEFVFSLYLSDQIISITTMFRLVENQDIINKHYNYYLIISIEASIGINLF
jgi:hypothetical protein